MGGIVGAVILCLLAVAVWPTEWSDTERGHHELALIWRAARADPDDEQVAWDRYAAWAEPPGEDVELQLICCAPVADQNADAPTPLSRLVVRRLNAEGMERAAEAMEELREEAAARELRAREGHERRAPVDGWPAHVTRAVRLPRLVDPRVVRELSGLVV